MTEAQTRRRTRGGGGAARRAARTGIKVETARYIDRQTPIYEFLSEDTLALIERNADTVLEEVGVNFADNPAALDRWKAAGASVEGERVRIPRGLARQLCKT
ncbi:MAG: trimethylamine methyltransferase family protein, partial [Pseudomonadota bacterium]